ncbi:hypothetical protein BKA70DRAFT_1437338 [Coprinopsis sp. MPI-PUGE-AT-0042]|nr:hypothetical protein BKA70DRAFT_1437338 [Coprinopsis sp. MPI-PUGE-AT-0042]
MVHVSAQILLAALAISPAIAAPYGLQYEDANEARNFDDVEARAGALTAAKAFTTLATSVGLGGVLGGFFKKKTPAPKRSFVDDAEDLDARALGEEDVEYLLVRDEDGSYSVYARTPGVAGLLKFGSAIGKVKQKLFGSSKYVLPAVAAGGVAVGTAAGRQANSRRSLEDDEEIMLVRGEDGELYVRGFGGIAKIGSLVKKAAKAIKGKSKYALPLVAAGGVASGMTSTENAVRTREYDEKLFERIFYDDESHFGRELDELD